MKPIQFKHQNIVYAENQDEYISMPARNTPEGYVISCWKGTWAERFIFLFTGKLWLNVKTYQAPLQPMSMQLASPFTVHKPSAEQVIEKVVEEAKQATKQ